MKNKIILSLSFALLLFFGASGAAQAAITPEQTAITFYTWYLKELNREGNPIDQKKTLAKYVSRQRLKQIDKWRAAEEYDVDYFVDAQDFNEKWKPILNGKAVVKGSAATLKIALAPPKPKPDDWIQILTLKFVKENGVWKIDEVTGASAAE